MIFFSEIKNIKVFTEDDIFIGLLHDLVFDFKEIPRITKIIVKSDKLQYPRLYIPMNYVLSMNKHMVVAKNYELGSLKVNELSIWNNIVDKQIIDIKGRKVVRVNDVILKQNGQNNLTILGVDTSAMGIWRWFGLNTALKKIASIFRVKLVPVTLPWRHIQPLELAHNKVKLNFEQEKLEKLHPEDLADYLEATSMDNIISTINLLDLDFAAEVIAELNLNYQIQLFRQIGIDKSVAVLSQMDPDEAVDVLVGFKPKTRANILQKMEVKRRQELEELLSFVGTEVGDYMNSEFFTVDVDMLANEVIAKIRNYPQRRSFLDYVYVCNNQGQLIGVFNLHELLLQSLANPVRKFMVEDPINIHLKTPLKSVQRKLIKYKLSALPVVDEYKKIIGLVSLDDVAENLIHMS
ncbi:hypothetical protein A3C23_03930 [Candidatus Roizmanbacteria bacterium RIFCSPHIGHO2_02_FULL_37_13b]|uniref:CBS domain-containing protein n=1 Tax=Candidatus Roizmanbacteria bacterium RIFCSPLOWO2_02_FULL_36_11 TaxID=1802071 RepID=A0A1F7JC27_9BACT|nr:MAG: hypothetical protein A3C23_03930 [Candidatus Roizmanbacteria bacterium RIFCSPHIGHO2_02_FULL_37_13b]OGK53178.1 MAG: hypothetical protein A3H78_06230 [Candidatus Roizmanbacteria bacterium RIFCSPLOWO2_02_FULL_36_11]